MLYLADIRYSPLVRTDFFDDKEWAQLCEAALAPTLEGYQPSLEIVDNRAYEGASWRQIADGLRRVSVAFVADGIAMSQPGYPVLVIDSWSETPREPFRCTAAALVSIEVNLNVANMDWEDFATSCHEDGVFRGFTG